MVNQCPERFVIVFLLPEEDKVECSFCVGSNLQHETSFSSWSLCVAESGKTGMRVALPVVFHVSLQQRVTQMMMKSMKKNVENEVSIFVRIPDKYSWVLFLLRLQNIRKTCDKLVECGDCDMTCDKFSTSPFLLWLCCYYRTRRVNWQCRYFKKGVIMFIPATCFLWEKRTYLQLLH